MKDVHLKFLERVNAQERRVAVLDGWRDDVEIRFGKIAGDISQVRKDVDEKFDAMYQTMFSERTKANVIQQTVYRPSTSVSTVKTSRNRTPVVYEKPVQSDFLVAEFAVRSTGKARVFFDRSANTFYLDAAGRRFYLRVYDRKPCNGAHRVASMRDPDSAIRLASIYYQPCQQRYCIANAPAT